MDDTYDKQPFCLSCKGIRELTHSLLFLKIQNLLCESQILAERIPQLMLNLPSSPFSLCSYCPHKRLVQQYHSMMPFLHITTTIGKCQLSTSSVGLINRKDSRPADKYNEDKLKSLTDRLKALIPISTKFQLNEFTILKHALCSIAYSKPH